MKRVKTIWINLLLSLVFLLSSFSYGYSYTGFSLGNEFKASLGLWFSGDEYKLYMGNDPFFSFSKEQTEQIFETFLRLPADFLWVNLSPGYQPLPFELLNTVVGKVLLLADLQFKKDLERVFLRYMVYYGVNELTDFPYFWIEPGRVYLGRDANNKFFIRKATIRVKVSTQRRKYRRFYSKVCDEMEKVIASSPNYKSLRDLFAIFDLASYLKKHLPWWEKEKKTFKNRKNPIIPTVECIPATIYHPEFYFSPYTLKAKYLFSFYRRRNQFFGGKRLVVALGGIKLKGPFAWVRSAPFPEGFSLIKSGSIRWKSKPNFVIDGAIAKTISSLVKQKKIDSRVVLIDHGYYDNKRWWILIYTPEDSKVFYIANKEFVSVDGETAKSWQVGEEKLYYVNDNSIPLYWYIRSQSMVSDSKGWRYELLFRLGEFFASRWEDQNYVKVSPKDFLIKEFFPSISVSLITDDNVEFLSSQQAVNFIQDFFDEVCKKLDISPSKDAKAVNSFFSPFLLRGQLPPWFVRKLSKDYNVVLRPYTNMKEKGWSKNLFGRFWGVAKKYRNWFLGSLVIFVAVVTNSLLSFPVFLPFLAGIKISKSSSSFQLEHFIEEENLKKLKEFLGKFNVGKLQIWLDNPSLMITKLEMLPSEALDDKELYQLWVTKLVLPLLGRIDPNKVAFDKEKERWFVYNSLNSLSAFRIENFPTDANLFKVLIKHTALYTQFLPVLLREMPENTDQLLGDYIDLLRQIIRFSRELDDSIQEINGVFTLFDLVMELPKYTTNKKGESNVKNKMGLISKILHIIDEKESALDLDKDDNLYRLTAWHIVNSPTVKKILISNTKNRTYTDLITCQLFLFSVLNESAQYDQGLASKVISLFVSREKNNQKILLLADLLEKLLSFSSYDSEKLEKKLNSFFRQFLAAPNGRRVLFNVLKEKGLLSPAVKGKLLADLSNYLDPQLLKTLDEDELAELITKGPINLRHKIIDIYIKEAQFDKVLCYSAMFVDRDDWMLVRYLMAVLELNRNEASVIEKEIDKLGREKLSSKILSLYNPSQDLDTAILILGIISVVDKKDGLNKICSMLKGLKVIDIPESSAPMLSFLVEAIYFSVQSRIVVDRQLLVNILKHLLSLNGNKVVPDFFFYQNIFSLALNANLPEFTAKAYNELEKLAQRNRKNDVIQINFAISSFLYSRYRKRKASLKIKNKFKRLAPVRYILLMSRVEDVILGLPSTESQSSDALKNIEEMKKLFSEIQLDKFSKVLVDVWKTFIELNLSESNKDFWLSDLNWVSQEISAIIFGKVSGERWYELRDAIASWYKLALKSGKIVFDYEVLRYLLLTMALAEKKEGSHSGFWESLEALSEDSNLNESFRWIMLWMMSDYISSYKDQVLFDKIMTSINGWQLLAEKLNSYLNSLQMVKKEKQKRQKEVKYESMLMVLSDLIISSRENRAKVKKLIESSVSDVEQIIRYPGLYDIYQHIEELDRKEQRAEKRLSSFLEVVLRLTKAITASKGRMPEKIKEFLNIADISYVDAENYLQMALQEFLKIWAEINAPYKGKLVVQFCKGDKVIDELIIPDEFPLNLFQYYSAQHLPEKINKIRIDYIPKYEKKRKDKKSYPVSVRFNPFWLSDFLNHIQSYLSPWLGNVEGTRTTLDVEVPWDIGKYKEIDNDGRPVIKQKPKLIRYKSAVPKNKIPKKAYITHYLLKEGWFALHGNRSVIATDDLVKLAELESPLKDYLFNIVSKKNKRLIEKSWRDEDKLVLVPVVPKLQVIPVIIWLKPHPLGGNQYVPYLILTKSMFERFNDFGEFVKCGKKRPVKGENWTLSFFRFTDMQRKEVLLGNESVGTKTIMFSNPYRSIGYTSSRKEMDNVSYTYVNWVGDARTRNLFLCPIERADENGENKVRFLLIASKSKAFLLSDSIDINDIKDGANIFSILFYKKFHSNVGADWWRAVNKITLPYVAVNNFKYVRVPLEKSRYLKIVLPAWVYLPWFSSPERFDPNRWVFGIEIYPERIDLHIYCLKSGLKSRKTILTQRSALERSGRYLFSMRLENTTVYLYNKETGEELEKKEFDFKEDRIKLLSVFPNYMFRKDIFYERPKIYRFVVDPHDSLIAAVGSVYITIYNNATLLGKTVRYWVENNRLQLRLMKFNIHNEGDVTKYVRELRLEVITNDKKNKKGVKPIFDIELVYRRGKNTNLPWGKISITKTYVEGLSLGSREFRSRWVQIGDTFSYGKRVLKYNNKKSRNPKRLIIKRIGICFGRLTPFWRNGFLKLVEERISRDISKIQLQLEVYGKKLSLGEFVIKREGQNYHIINESGKVISLYKDKTISIFSILPNLEKQVAFLKELDMSSCLKNGKYYKQYLMPVGPDRKIKLVVNNSPKIDQLLKETPFIFWGNLEENQLYLILPKLNIILPILQWYYKNGQIHYNFNLLDKGSNGLELNNNYISLGRLLGISKFVTGRKGVFLDLTDQKDLDMVIKFIKILYGDNINALKYLEFKQVLSITLSKNWQGVVKEQSRDFLIKMPGYLIPFLTAERLSFSVQGLAKQLYRFNVQIKTSQFLSQVFTNNLKASLDDKGPVLVDLESLFPDLKKMFSSFKPLTASCIGSRKKAYRFPTPNGSKGQVAIYISENSKIDKLLELGLTYLVCDERKNCLSLLVFSGKNLYNIPLLRFLPQQDGSVEIIDLLSPENKYKIKKFGEEISFDLSKLLFSGTSIDENKYLKIEEKQAYRSLMKELSSQGQEERTQDQEKQKKRKIVGTVKLNFLFSPESIGELSTFFWAGLSSLLWLSFTPLAGFVSIGLYALYLIFKPQLIRILSISQSIYEPVLVDKFGLSSDLARPIGLFFEAVISKYPWAKRPIENILYKNKEGDINGLTIDLLKFFLTNMGEQGRVVAQQLVVSSSLRISEDIRRALINLSPKSNKFSYKEIYRFLEKTGLLGVFSALSGVNFNARLFLNRPVSFSRDKGSKILFNLIVFNEQYWRNLFGSSKFAMDYLKKLFARSHSLTGRFLRRKMDYALYYLRELAKFIPQDREAFYSALRLYRSEFYTQPNLLQSKKEKLITVKGGIVFNE